MKKEQKYSENFQQNSSQESADLNFQKKPLQQDLPEQKLEKYVEQHNGRRNHRDQSEKNIVPQKKIYF